jgi:hypothetical protein
MATVYGSGDDPNATAPNLGTTCSKISGTSYKAVFTAYYPDNSKQEGGYYDCNSKKLNTSKQTCAAPSDIPYGSYVWIESCTGGDGVDYSKRLYIVTDRGQDIVKDSKGYYHIDLLFKDKASSDKFGKIQGSAIIQKKSAPYTTGVSSGGTSGSKNPITTFVWIGHSRVVFLKNTSVVQSDDKLYCEGSIGYDKVVGYMNQAENEGAVKSGAATIIWAGINDLRNVDRYVSGLNEYGKQWKNKGAACYVMSETPMVDEIYKKQYPSWATSTNNKAIQDFNSKIKSGVTEMTYIDVWSQIVNDVNANTVDTMGVHYTTKELNKKIHDYVRNFITNSSNNTSLSSGDESNSGIEVTGSSYDPTISADVKNSIFQEYLRQKEELAKQGIDMYVEDSNFVFDYSIALVDYIKYTNVHKLKGIQWHPNQMKKQDFKQDYMVVIRKKLYFAACMTSDELFLRLYQINNFSAIQTNISTSSIGSCSISLKGGERVVCIEKKSEENQGWQSYEELLNGLTNIDDEGDNSGVKWRMGVLGWEDPSSAGVDYKNLMKAREAKYGWRYAEKCDWQPMDEIIVYSKSRTKKDSSGKYAFEKIFFGYIHSIKKDFNSQGPTITIQASDQTELLSYSFQNNLPSYYPGRYNQGYLDTSFNVDEFGLLKIQDPLVYGYIYNEQSDETAKKTLNMRMSQTDVFAGIFPGTIIKYCCLCAGIPWKYLNTRIEPVEIIPYVVQIRGSVNYETSSEFKSRYEYCQQVAERSFMEFFQDEEGNIVFKIPNYVIGCNTLDTNNCGLTITDEFRDLIGKELKPEATRLMTMSKLQEICQDVTPMLYTTVEGDTVKSISTGLYGSTLYATEIRNLNLAQLQKYSINDKLKAGIQLLVFKYDVTDVIARSEYVDLINNSRVTAFANQLYTSSYSDIKAFDLLRVGDVTMSMLTDSFIQVIPQEDLIGFTLTDSDENVYTTVDINGMTFGGENVATSVKIKRTVPNMEAILKFGVRPMQSLETGLVCTEARAELYGALLLSRSISQRYTATVKMVENPDIKVGNPVRFLSYDEHPNPETGEYSEDTPQSVYYVEAVSRNISCEGVSTMTLTLSSGRVMGEASIYDKMYPMYKTFYKLDMSDLDQKTQEAIEMFQKMYDSAVNNSDSDVSINGTDGDSSDNSDSTSGSSGSGGTTGIKFPLPSGSWHASSGMWRNSGTVFDNKGEFHGGIDLGANEGTAIYAAYAGTVYGTNSSGPNTGSHDYGYWVCIQSTIGGKSFLHLYGHMCEEPMVKAGDKVTAGQQIGKVGNTGDSNGNHLHFEMTATTTLFDKTKRVCGWNFLQGYSPFDLTAIGAKGVIASQGVDYDSSTGKIKYFNEEKKSGY